MAGKDIMAIPLSKLSEFTTFDGSISIRTDHQRPDRYRHLELLPQDQVRIARGGGYSYSAASFGNDTLVQEMTSFNRFLTFDSNALTFQTIHPLLQFRTEKPYLLEQILQQ